MNTPNTISKFSSQVPTGEKNNDDAEPIDIKNPYKRENRQCILCKLNITPDYKNVRLLSQFQSMHKITILNVAIIKTHYFYYYLL